MNRPSDRVWRSLATTASVIGLRAKATAMPVPELDPLGVLGGQGEGEERIVAASRPTRSRRSRPARPLGPPRPTPAGSNPMPPSTTHGPR